MIKRGDDDDFDFDDDEEEENLEERSSCLGETGRKKEESEMMYVEIYVSRKEPQWNPLDTDKKMS